MKGERIDIMQEFVELNQHEDMFGFFEFSIERAGTAALNGLCKIAKSKASDTKLRYFSLTFIADAPNPAGTAAIAAALDRLEEDTFKDALLSAEAVVPVPAMTQGSENYLRQFDIMFNERVDPGKEFVMDRLLPALRQCIGLHARDVMWWDDAPPQPAGAVTAAASEAAGSPALNRLRAYAKRFVAGARK